ncbi:MAG: hypothetical protein KDB27_16995 [Planctomycetales bacterium]|nr:hypothetical protein [Planctomycetales bacterium]
MTHFRLILLILAALVVRGSIAAELDSINLGLSAEYEAQLRWDNVEGPPLWTGGCPVRYLRSHSVHIAELKPGTSSYIRLPAFSMLRVSLCDSKASVEVWSSSDGRLYKKLSPAWDASKHQLLVAPQSLEDLSIEIRCPVEFAATQRVAFFVSRHDPVPDPAPYRKPLYVCRDTLRLCTTGTSDSENVFELSPSCPREFVVEGPCRVECETRLHYPYGESETLQPFRVRVGCDGRLLKYLEYHVNVERHHSVTLEGCPVTVSLPAKAFFDCPPGRHWIRLSTPHTVFAQLRQQECPQYLLGINDHVAPNSPRRPAPLDLLESYWLATDEQITDYSCSHQTSNPTAHELANLEQVLLKVANDNTRKQGGISAWWTMHQAATRRAFERSLRTVAEKLKLQNTFYRSILPTNASALEFGWMRFRGDLSAAGGHDSDVITIAQQHLQSSVGNLSLGGFAPVGNSAEGSQQTYVLPLDRTDSQLRISVVDDGRFCGRLSVQLDDGPPISLELKANHAFEPNTKPTVADAAVAGLWHQHGGFGHGTLGGSFASLRVAAPSLNVASTEIYLPQHVGMVSVSADDSSGQQPLAALHLRSSRYRTLTESEFLVYRSTLSEDPIELARMLNSDCDSPSIAWREIWNRFRPIMRLVRSHDATFANGVQPMETRGEVTHQLHELLNDARQLQAAKEWLPAIEVWSEVITSGDTEAFREAISARATALANVGEHFLAERQMRSVVLFSADDAARSAAVKWLRDYYRHHNDIAATERLAASIFLRSPSPEAFQFLAESFLENGRYNYALSVLLLVDDESNASRISMMRAAARSGWWQTYDRLMQTVSNSEELEFWRGIRSLHNGNYESAQRYFAAAGEKGIAYNDHLETAFPIASSLRSPGRDDRLSALHRWQDWNATHPGPYLWQEEMTAVKLSGGTHAVYSQNLDSYAQYFRANRDVPVQLKVVGPIRLKLEVRPALAPDTSLDEPARGWFAVSVDGKPESIPILSNYPSSTLSVVGSDEQAGQRVEHIVSVPRGEHWVEVYGTSHDVFARCFIERPEHPITVLPPLTVAAHNTIRAGTFGAVRATTKGRVRLLPSGPNESPKLLPIIEVDADATDTRTFAETHSGRVISEGTKKTSKPTTAIPPSPPAIHVDAQVSKASHHERPKIRRLPIAPMTPGQIRLLSHTEPATNNDSHNDASFIGVYVESELPEPDTERGDTSDEMLPQPNDEPTAESAPASDADLNFSRSEVVHRLCKLLRRAMTEEDSRSLQVEAGRLRDLYPNDQQIDALFDQLTQGATWRPFSQFSRTAGVRVVEVPAWKPEAPIARTRTALLPALESNERLVVGGERLIVTVDNDAPDDLSLAVSLAAIDFVASQPNTAVISVDDRLPERVDLHTKDEPHLVTVRLEPGKHRLSVGTLKHVANQYLRVRIDAKNHVTPPLTSRERYYHAATIDQPLEFAVSGPARLRIDELRDQTTLTKYVNVLSGERRSFSLRPMSASSEALFRIFELTTDRRDKHSETTYTPLAPLPVPSSQITTEPTINVSTRSDGQFDDRSLALVTHELPGPSIRFEDLYELGGQEDATWSFTPGWYQRRPVEESEFVRAPDEFTEFSFARRFRSDREVVDSSELIYRERESAGSTFGIGYLIEHENLFAFDECADPYRNDLYIRLQGNAYVQDTDDTPAIATDTAEWSASLRGTVGQRVRLFDKLTRSQSIAVFGRWLSMDENQYRPGEIDQDIFTPYKNDHRSGFILSDSLWYRPLLDTRLWLRGFAVSNENFNPFDTDSLGFRLGWDQAVGPMDVAVSYRLARFLNDEDRVESYTQHVLNFALLADCWLGPRRRCELGANVQHNLNQSDTSLYFFFAWFMDNGRDYRDFRSADRAFLQLRRAMSRRRPNNRYLFVEG